MDTHYPIISLRKDDAQCCKRRRQHIIKADSAGASRSDFPEQETVAAWRRSMLPLLCSGTIRMERPCAWVRLWCGRNARPNDKGLGVVGLCRGSHGPGAVAGTVSGSRLTVAAQPIVLGKPRARRMPVLQVWFRWEPDTALGGVEGNDGVRCSGGPVSPGWSRRSLGCAMVTRAVPFATSTEQRRGSILRVLATPASHFHRVFRESVLSDPSPATRNSIP